MAEAKRSIRTSMRRLDCDWGYVLEGTADQLIQSGEVWPDWLEFGSDVNARGQTVRTRVLSRLDGREVKITSSGRDWFNVRVTWTAAEIVARRAELETQRQQEANARQEQERLQRLPKSDEEYRARVLEYAGYLAHFIDGFLREGRDGYRFDIATYEVSISAYRSMEAAIRRGRIISESKTARPALRLISSGRQ